jgi:ribose-phosphate pyrophosphokinase
MAANSVEVRFAGFPNGEVKIIGDRIEAKSAVAVFPKIRDINKQLIEFMLMCGLCEDCAAIFAVIPYIPYSRQNDSKARAMVSKILGMCRVKSVITVDIHNRKTFEKHDVINILPHEIFADTMSADISGDQSNQIIVAPDIGAIYRAKKFANAYCMDMAVIDKNARSIDRASAVANKRCIIVDDIIDSGRTIKIAADILCSCNAASLSALVSHGFFSPDSNGESLSFPQLDALYVSESFEVFGRITHEHLTIAPLDRAISSALAQRCESTSLDKSASNPLQYDTCYVDP